MYFSASNLNRNAAILARMSEEAEDDEDDSFGDEYKIAEVLSLPEDQKVGVIMAAGFPDEEPATPPRKNVEFILTRYE